MSEISRSALFGKLNSLAYKAIEGATVFCKLRGNPYVELVHWFQQILQTPDSDMHRIIRHFELDSSRVAKDMTDALDRLPRGATSISDLSSHVESAVERGWVYATLMFGESQVRTGHLVVGIRRLHDLVKPVHQLHVRVAPQLAEHGGAFDRLVCQAVQLAEQRRSTDLGHAARSLAMKASASRCRSPASDAVGRVPSHVVHPSWPERPSFSAGTCSRFRTRRTSQSRSKHK